MTVKTYSEKLKDPRWQKKRLEILERDNWSCQECGSEDKQLQVHHLKYGKNPWDVESDLLITLCEDCHKSISEINDRIKDKISDYLSIEGSPVTHLKEILSYIDVCVNSYQPWGADIESINTVTTACVMGAKNRGFWESINRKNKNGEE